MNIVELHQVKKDFGTLSVIKSLDLTLEQGQILGFFGHNGAGKTTTMKMILGLHQATSGQVKVFNHDPCSSQFNAYRYQLGFLPENVSFYPQLTGLEVLQFFAKLKQVPKQHCVELIEQVGLTHACQRRVKNYSKGMKQRLGLAQALLTEPSLLLLDEPTVGLDPIATHELYQILKTLKNKGCSVILCSHILAGVEKIIDKAAILAQGELQAYGSINELRKQQHLPTQIKFKGYFNIEQLAQKLEVNIQTHQTGEFSFETEPSLKLQHLKILQSQLGLTDFDTEPPSLDALYKKFMEPKETENAHLEQQTTKYQTTDDSVDLPQSSTMKGAKP